MNKQRGGTLLGFVLGLLVGLGTALAVAVYITKVPMPFMNKVQSGTADKDAEAQKNRDWDPNAGLASKPATKPGDAAPAASRPAEPPPAAAPSPVAPVAPVAPTPAPTPAPQSATGQDLLGDLARARAEGKVVTTAAAAVGNADPFHYFLQAGAYRTPEDAEQQRVKLSLLGVQARVSERDQAGRIVFRVRIGPFDKKEDSDKIKDTLTASNIESVLVRVQKN